MSSTIKRIHLALTKEDLKQLEELMDRLGESKSEVIKRALILLHYINFSEDDKKMTIEEMKEFYERRNLIRSTRIGEDKDEK